MVASASAANGSRIYSGRSQSWTRRFWTLDQEPTNETIKNKITIDNYLYPQLIKLWEIYGFDNSKKTLTAFVEREGVEGLAELAIGNIIAALDTARIAQENSIELSNTEKLKLQNIFELIAALMRMRPEDFRNYYSTGIYSNDYIQSVIRSAVSEIRGEIVRGSASQVQADLLVKILGYSKIAFVEG